MKSITWYYDVISPFAYLQAVRLHELPKDVDVQCRPALFAGFLNHWGQLGPAEVPPKKEFIFRQCYWLAKRRGVPFNMPPKHPFNPLRALRLAIALDNDLTATLSIFNSIWVDGHLPDDDAGWAAMQEAVGIEDGDRRVGDPAVKQALLANGQAAIAAGAFGVPTFIVEGQVFWGDDSLEMVIDYLDDPDVINAEELAKIRGVTASAERPRPT